MHITNLTLRSWKCFRGEHSLPLKPTTYAVTARMEGDVERSNWLGKSSLMQAIAFALYGRHHEGTEDAWITRGEKMGGVELTLDDGTRITRSRTLGKRTELRVALEGAPVAAMGDEAQQAIERLVGLTERDFVATCYFEQKRMSQLVTMRASERMEVVSEWLRLDPLERCEARTRAMVGELLQAFDGLQRERQAQEAVRASALGNLTWNELLGEVTKADAAHAKALRSDEEASAALLAQSRVESLLEASQAFARLLAEGKALQEQLTNAGVKGGDLTVFEAEVRACREQLSHLEERKGSLLRDLQIKSKGARGEFDGRCPASTIECPATSLINDLAKKNRQLVAAVETDLASLRDDEAAARRQLAQAEGHLGEMRRTVERLREIKRRMEELLPKKREAEGVTLGNFSDLNQRAEAAHARVRETAVVLESLRERVRRCTAAQDRLKALDAEVTKVFEKLGTAREALAVFGKQGAQRRIAERALAEIEDGANAMLRACDIPLSLQVRWSREGQGLATACEACGNPFGTSAKVKSCARCGADRGPKLVNRLDIALNARSGAAEDLAGGAIQLAASAWLRGDRLSDWSSALIDEPFGALDTSNRRSFAAHLQSMLGSRYGFRQAFVIAHHPAILDSLPGRILITAGPKGSSVAVVT